VAEPGIFYADRVDQFDVVSPSGNEKDTVVIDFYPENVTDEFTILIRGVRGVRNIASARGAMSGLSASYFLATSGLAATPSTVLFDDDFSWHWDGTNEDSGQITASFGAFGRLQVGNKLTIEVLSRTNRYYYYTWTVTPQMVAAVEEHHPRPQGYDIVIDNLPASELPEIGNGGGSDPGNDSGFDVGLGDWNDKTVIL
jgi:hypothetical protein